MNRFITSLTLLLASINCYAVDMMITAAQPAYTSESTTKNYATSGADAWSEKVQEVLMHALTQMDVTYKYGGNTPETGFDCSGFVRYVFNEATQISLPRTASAISRLGRRVSKSELQPGDLVFFNTLRASISHVGIYVGNNKFIHSPRTGKNIRLDKMSNTYWAKHFKLAKRLNPER